MRTVVLAFSILVLAATAHAAPRNSARDNGGALETKCKEQMGKEQSEGEATSASSKCNASAIA